MNCVVCGKLSNSVIDSRVSSDKKSVRRRRECPSGHRWTTHEVREEDMLVLAIGSVKARVRIDRAIGALQGALNVLQNTLK